RNVPDPNGSAACTCVRGSLMHGHRSHHSSTTTQTSSESRATGCVEAHVRYDCAENLSGQELFMADLIIIAYDTEATAEAARKKLVELQKEYLIELGDAVVAVRQLDGHVKLNQLINTTAAGAASGGM